MEQIAAERSVADSSGEEWSGLQWRSAERIVFLCLQVILSLLEYKEFDLWMISMD